MNPPPATATAGPRGGDILAPPPRVALSGASSPVSDDQRSSSAVSASAAGPSSDVASTVAAAAAAAATQVLRTKDARIAELEHELAVMEGVFTRELDKLSRAESDSSSSWQAKCGALAAQLQDAETERDELRVNWEAARRDALGREDEVRQLRGQVRGLKEWVSTSTRSDGAATVTDDQIGLSMTKLGNELQNWVLVNLRRARIGTSVQLWYQVAQQDEGGWVDTEGDQMFQKRTGQRWQSWGGSCPCTKRSPQHRDFICCSLSSPDSWSNWSLMPTLLGYLTTRLGRLLRLRCFCPRLV